MYRKVLFKGLLTILLIFSSWEIVNNWTQQVKKSNPIQTLIKNVSSKPIQTLIKNMSSKPVQTPINNSPPSNPIKIIAKINPTIFPTPSVILNRFGGIGDQLYQYAFSYSITKNLNTTLYLAVALGELTTDRKFLPNQRLFTLDQFNIDKNTRYLNKELIETIPNDKRFHLNELGRWKKTVLPNNKVIIVEDFFQAEMYFDEYKEDIKKQFTFKPKIFNQLLNNSNVRILHNNILQSESIAVHIRRGDFIGLSQNRVISISYQIKAIKLLKNTLLKYKNLIYFIFSDDIAYVKNVLKHEFSNLNLVFMPENGSSLIDFHLMCNCKHFIITNSGFSWWAAYLGNYKDKFVIAPFPRNRQRFYNYFGKQNYTDFRKKHNPKEHKKWLFWNKSYPDDWITINPYESYGDLL